MASTKLSPTEVVAALKDLTPEKAKELFFHLKVQLKTLDDIDTNHRGNMRKIYYVQAWFDHDVEASWEKIVAGLELIEMKVLAATLATRQGLRGTLTSAAVNTTPHLPSSPTTASSPSHPSLGPVAHHPPSPSLAGPMAHHPPSPSLGPVAHHPPSPSLAGPMAHRPSFPSLGPVAHPTAPSDRVAQVRAEIDRLIKLFSNLMSGAQTEMSAKEAKHHSFLTTVVDCLLGLPVAQKAPHDRFFYKNEDDFLMARNMRKLFTILRRYCNYRNYEILKVMVMEFCEAVLQRRMQEYCESLEKFEKATVIDVYLKAISAGVVLASEFTKMVMIIDKRTSVCTLHEVRKLKEIIAERASLQSYSVYIGDISQSSVRLVLWFPPSCLGWILGVMTPTFLGIHLLSGVVLHRSHLSILEWPHGKLV